MPWYEDDEQDDDVSFEPDDFDEEITDLDQLWEFADYGDEDLHEYEFHGTGDTGG